VRLGDCESDLFAIPGSLSKLSIDFKQKRLLLSPYKPAARIDDRLIGQLATLLSSRLKIDILLVRAALDHVSFIDWSGIRITDGGDRVRIASANSRTGDSRDASWVQVSIKTPLIMFYLTYSTVCRHLHHSISLTSQARCPYCFRSP
jgi:hypothetical protein